MNSEQSKNRKKWLTTTALVGSLGLGAFAITLSVPAFSQSIYLSGGGGGGGTQNDAGGSGAGGLIAGQKPATQNHGAKGTGSAGGNGGLGGASTRKAKNDLTAQETEALDSIQISTLDNGISDKQKTGRGGKGGDVGINLKKDLTIESIILEAGNGGESGHVLTKGTETVGVGGQGGNVRFNGSDETVTFNDTINVISGESSGTGTGKSRGGSVAFSAEKLIIGEGKSTTINVRRNDGDLLFKTEELNAQKGDVTINLVNTETWTNNDNLGVSFGDLMIGMGHKVIVNGSGQYGISSITVGELGQTDLTPAIFSSETNLTFDSQSKLTFYLPENVENGASLLKNTGSGNIIINNTQVDLRLAGKDLRNLKAGDSVRLIEGGVNGRAATTEQTLSYGAKNWNFDIATKNANLLASLKGPNTGGGDNGGNTGGGSDGGNTGGDNGGNTGGGGNGGNTGGGGNGGNTGGGGNGGNTGGGNGGNTGGGNGGNTGGGNGGNTGGGNDGGNTGGGNGGNTGGGGNGGNTGGGGNGGNTGGGDNGGNTGGGGNGGNTGGGDNGGNTGGGGNGGNTGGGDNGGNTGGGGNGGNTGGGGNGGNTGGGDNGGNTGGGSNGGNTGGGDNGGNTGGGGNGGNTGGGNDGGNTGGGGDGGNTGGGGNGGNTGGGGNGGNTGGGGNGGNTGGGDNGGNTGGGGNGGNTGGGNDGGNTGGGGDGGNTGGGGNGGNTGGGGNGGNTGGGGNGGNTGGGDNGGNTGGGGNGGNTGGGGNGGNTGGGNDSGNTGGSGNGGNTGGGNDSGNTGGGGNGGNTGGGGNGGNTGGGNDSGNIGGGGNGGNTGGGGNGGNTGGGNDGGNTGSIIGNDDGQGNIYTDDYGAVTINRAKANAYFQSNAAVLNALNFGADQIATIDDYVLPTDPKKFYKVIEGVAFLQGSGLNQKVETGSHIKNYSYHLMGGGGIRYTQDKGNLLVALFLEHGDGNFKSYHREIYGKGDFSYTGGGLYTKQTWDNGWFLYGSGRVGRVKRDFKSSSMIDGGFDDKSSYYYGFHIGGGKELEISADNKLTLNGKLLWTEIEEFSTTTKANEHLTFDTAHSLRTHLGARIDHYATPKVKLYVGAAWEQELDGEVAGKLDNFRVDKPDFSGASAVFEFGGKYEQIPGMPGWVANAGFKGVAGKREEFSSKVGINYRW